METELAQRPFLLVSLCLGGLSCNLSTICGKGVVGCMVAQISCAGLWEWIVARSAFDTPHTSHRTREAGWCLHYPPVHINLDRHVQGLPNCTVRTRWPRSVIEGLRLSALVFRHNKAAGGGGDGRWSGDGHYSFGAAAVVAGCEFGAVSTTAIGQHRVAA